MHKAVGNKRKVHLSLACYILGLGASLWFPKVSFALYTLVAIIWLLPDKRIENALGSDLDDQPKRPVM